MKFLFLHHGHCTNTFTEGRFVYFETPQADEVQINAENIADESEKMESFDKESAKLIQEFNQAIDTSKMNREEAVQFQTDVLEWISDGFLDNNESMQLTNVINQLQNDLEHEIKDEAAKSREKAAETIESEYRKPSLKSDTAILFSHFIKTDGRRFKVKPADLNQLKSVKPRGKFPPKLQKKLSKMDASFLQSEINPAENLKTSLSKDPELKDLGEWLSDQFDEHADQLSSMGIDHKITEFTPAEAVKFTQYLMTVKFENRINTDYDPHAGDSMSILELSTKKNPVVCRNTVQIFQGYMLALQKIQARSGAKNTPLESVYVKSTAAALFNQKGGAPGLPKDHVWNEVYVRKGPKISVLHIDPNWGIQQKEDKFDQTEKRIIFTGAQMLDNPQSLTDVTANSIGRFMKQFQRKDSVKLTPQAADALWNRIRSLYFVDNSVDNTKLRNTLITMRNRLDPSTKIGKEMRNKIASFLVIKECLRTSSSSKKSLSFAHMKPADQTNYLARLNAGVNILRKAYSAMKTNPYARDNYQREYDLTKGAVKAHLKNLLIKFNSTDLSLLKDSPKNTQLIASLSSQFDSLDIKA